MNLKIPKNDKYQWTQHSIYKMRQYGLSPQRIIRVIRNPQRIEEGIVPKTIAVMQPASTRGDHSSMRGGPASVRHRRTSAGKPAKMWSQEIWVMYQARRAGNPKSEILNPKTSHPALSPLGREGKERIKIISVWRYPGVSPKNNPIPEEILNDIRNTLNKY